MNYISPEYKKIQLETSDVLTASQNNNSSVIDDEKNDKLSFIFSADSFFG